MNGPGLYYSSWQTADVNAETVAEGVKAPHTLLLGASVLVCLSSDGHEYSCSGEQPRLQLQRWKWGNSTQCFVLGAVVTLELLWMLLPF